MSKQWMPRMNFRELGCEAMRSPGERCVKKGGEEERIERVYIHPPLSRKVGAKSVEDINYNYCLLI